ncbi:UDP-glycosyltransferase 83A1-like [Mercurialis annua]|uniref:UDP-glycosyltransferase 83A1-like n=1 Tax=Mercurialis annua TaxID=3986 RepID=UPI00215E2941|nr:UDP-glycosyltransferase 83A1-like [Mercurialis annua]
MGRSSKPHVILVPYPAQGHVAPLMKLAYNLASHGIKVTFVNTEFIHMKIVSAMSPETAHHCPINLVAIPDGLESNSSGEQDRKKLIENGPKHMWVHLQNLIESINCANNDTHVTHLIADIANLWALEVAKKMCIKTVSFLPYALGNLAMMLHAPKLVEAGILDDYGLPIQEDQLVSLSKELPTWNINELAWSINGDSERQKFIYKHFIKNITEHIKISDSVVANSSYELEPSACHLIPNILPIGPLLASAHTGLFAGNLWPEDSTCSRWLDQQPTGSVIYAAFGSTVICNQHRFIELAHGLAITGRPFLWVVRSDFTKDNGAIEEFMDSDILKRIQNFGKIVNWAPQEKVLAHPSIACFFSHCGWNSTMEGVSMGVPFLCWPYIVDQFHNRNYICEAWKVGLAVNSDENGIVTRHEIKSKIEELVSDKDIKANSLKLKEIVKKSVGEDGTSYKHFLSFVGQIKH